MTLINLIIASYSSILFAVGAIGLVIFLLGTYLIIKATRQSNRNPRTLSFSAAPKSAFAEQMMLPDTANDVTSIAGEDPMATQLDLARAYIETGKKQFAKIILKTVIREGSTAHQEEAQRLLGSI